MKQNDISLFSLGGFSRLFGTAAKKNSENCDPLHKFRLVFDALNDACKRHFPTRLILIDESLIGLKNRTELIQYIPNKHHHKWE